VWLATALAFAHATLAQRAAQRTRAWIVVSHEALGEAQAGARVLRLD
jgi:hypothetical protein